MEGPRPPQTTEFDSVLRFLNLNLRAGRKWSILEEYPTALATGNLHNIRIITENDQILSHAVVRPLVVKTNVGIFKVAAIGSVVTDPIYRNQGLSQKVIQECLDLSMKQECDIAILWTNLFEFYRKFGFELAGSELSFLINREMPVPSTHIRVVKGAKVDPEAILRMYNQHTVCSVRTVDEIRKYLSIPNSNIYTAWNMDGQMVAYAVEGKGADLQAYVHEWGGLNTALLPLLNHIFREQKRPLTLIVPQHSQNLVQKLRSYDIGEVPGFLGMVKVLNHVNLFAKINRALKGEHEVRLQKHDDGFYIFAGGSKFKTESESDIVRLIFGPQKPTDLYPFDTKTAATLENILPVPLWIWGWDSI